MYRALLSQSGFSMDRLATLCELADVGSFAKASKGDSNTASLMSRQIRELESFFGIELVRRKGRGLELTGAGRDLAAIGRQGFQSIADFAARCEGREWTARIVASNSVAQWLLLPRLPSIGADSLNVRFEIHHAQTRDMVAATREGTYDIAFVRKDALVPGLHHADLGTISFSLFVPVTLARKPPATIAEALTDLPIALPIGGTLRSQVERLAGKRPLHLSVACTSYLQAAEAAKSGFAAAVLPDIAAASLAPERFHRLPLRESYRLALAWLPRNVDTRPALAGLIEALKTSLAVS